MSDEAWVVNAHGFVKAVPRSLLWVALRNGCREVQPSDWRYLTSSQGVFCCPGVEGLPKHVLGDRPVLVTGQGPSRVASMPEAWRLQINPRPDSPDCDAVLALDEDVFADVGGNLWDYPHHHRPLFIGPHCRKPSRHAKVYRFQMPVHPVDGSQQAHVNLAHEGAISELRLSGIAAILVAQYLTTGPIVLAGFDLTTVEHRGQSFDYAEKQLGGWRKALRVLTNVYAHPELTGPLVPMLPSLCDWGERNTQQIWIPAENAPQNRWLLIGGGYRRGMWREIENAVAPGTIAACNKAITLCANPTHYTATDDLAVQHWGALASAANKKYGTSLWTRDTVIKSGLAGENWGVYEYDVANQREYSRTQVAHGRSVGVLQLQAALARGATEIHLCGYDGYRAEDELEYAAKEGRDWEAWREAMNSCMADVLQQIVNDRKEVRFVWHGDSVLHRYMTLPANVEVRNV